MPRRGLYYTVWCVLTLWKICIFWGHITLLTLWSFHTVSTIVPWRASLYHCAMMCYSCCIIVPWRAILAVSLCHDVLFLLYHCAMTCYSCCIIVPWRAILAVSLCHDVLSCCIIVPWRAILAVSLCHDVLFLLYHHPNAALGTGQSDANEAQNHAFSWQQFDSLSPVTWYCFGPGREMDSEIQRKVYAKMWGFQH